MDLLGIDIGNDSWTMVHLKSTVFNVGIERFVALTGASQEERFEEIKGYIAERKLRNVRVALGLPRASSLSMLLNVPSPKSDAIEGILSYELEKHIPFSPDELCYGFQILKKDRKIFSVLLAAARKDRVEDMVRGFTEAGLRPDCVATWHASLFNALYYSNNISQGKNVAFIGLNHHYSALTLDIFSDLIPVYSKNIRVSKNELQQERWIGLLEKEMNRSLLSLGGAVAKRRLDEGIIVSDEEPQEEFLQELSTAMTMPFKAQGLSKLGLPATAAPALGAALCAADKGKIKINLTHSSAEDNPTPLYLNNLVLCTVILLLALLTGSTYLIRDRAMISRLESAMTELRIKKAGVQKLTDRMDSINRRIDVLERIDGRRSPTPLDITKELTELLPKGTWLTDLDYRGDSVYISGLSDRASMLIMKLGESEFFEDVGFAGPVARTGVGKERFRINFKVRGYDGGGSK